MGTVGQSPSSSDSTRSRAASGIIPQRWLPAAIHRQPLATVASSIAVQAVSMSIGNMFSHACESWCQACAPPWWAGFMKSWSL